MKQPATPSAFSTVGLPEQRRVELWESHNADALIGLRCRTLTSTVLEATEINVQLDRLHLARVLGTPHVVERDQGLIRRHPAEAVALFFSLAGEAFFYHDDGVRIVQPGQMLMCDADRPFMRGFSHGLEELVLKIPRDLFAEATGVEHVAQPVVVGFADGANAVAHALASHTSAAARADDSRPADERTLLSLVADLVGNEAAVPTSVHRTAAETYIEHHFREGALSVRQVAAAIGISSRHLSRVFADAETTFPKFVLKRRLEAAHTLLQRPEASSMAISEIAHHCGFTSAAHFSHAFTSRYGERATDVRRRALAARSVSVA
ncbi:AraC family transcriptional regulator [Streptomyces sp. NPDC001027]|uniref:AraC family transcriptional regulator n=1 Tax=Streptomyces sp. NPDC001027 TaxID=3154771 RepID=UPI00331A11B3